MYKRQHLSRRLKTLGHDARLMPAKYVRPYSKGQKNDFRDGEAIAEAVQRDFATLSEPLEGSRFLSWRASRPRLLVTLDGGQRDRASVRSCVHRYEVETTLGPSRPPGSQPMITRRAFGTKMIGHRVAAFGCPHPLRIRPVFEWRTGPHYDAAAMAAGPV